MNMKDVLSMINETVGDIKCPHTSSHCFQLAIAVLQKQKEDDALIAEAISPEAGQAIRSS
jgi:hypothetical protein